MATALQSDIEKICRNYQCGICHDVFIEPKLLKCAHTFCKSCLQQCRATGIIRDASKIRCPMCRQETQLPCNGVAGLPTNFQLQSLLEEISQLDVHATNTSSWPEGAEPTTCQTHEGEALNLYCETCEKLACESCVEVDHRGSAHVKVILAAVSAMYRKTLTDLFPAFEKDIKTMKEDLHECLVANKQYIDKTSRLVITVQDKASEIVAKVRAEEVRLLDELDFHKDDHESRLNDHKRLVKRLLHRKKQALKKARDFVRESGDAEFFSFYPTSYNLMKQLLEERQEKLVGLHSVPVLVPDRNAAAAMAGINFGKIAIKENPYMNWKVGREAPYVNSK